MKSSSASADTSDVTSRFLGLIRDGDLAAVHHMVLQHRWLLQTDLGISPILLALRHRKRAVANVLAFMGKKLDIVEASALGVEKRVREWIGFHSAAVHQRDTFGFTALHYACLYEHVHLVKALLEAGANPDAMIPGSATSASNLTSNPKILSRLKSAGNRSRGLAA